MNEISIVTAFFDIGRKDWKGFERDNTTYANYFKFWARLKNHLVVYTEPKMAEQVKKIRADYNLLDKTTIIVIEDLTYSPCLKAGDSWIQTILAY